jgi:hypothetical protein
MSLTHQSGSHARLCLPAWLTRSISAEGLQEVLREAPVRLIQSGWFSQVGSVRLVQSGWFTQAGSLRLVQAPQGSTTS